ncbi:MAG TPA: TetR family transcriptional regulator C-terminal domain-containing protein [Gemmatimonadaceae bacterium]|nr:TetR family transcriptional regulator C-terminal domain-containing protein [Gemmatimonadaceae bacterium]
MLRVVAEYGYDGASTQRIAHAASLTPGLIHYHFASKQEILLALVELLARIAHEGVEKHAARAQDDRARLHAFLDAMLQLGAGSNPEGVAAWVAVTAEAIREPKVARAVRAVLASWQGELQTLCAPLTPSRRAAEKAAAALVAFVQGCFVQAAVAPDSIPSGSAAPAARAMAAALLPGARP